VIRIALLQGETNTVKANEEDEEELDLVVLPNPVHLFGVSCYVNPTFHNHAKIEHPSRGVPLQAQNFRNHTRMPQNHKDDKTERNQA
jgi:hypothetical protein